MSEVRGRLGRPEPGSSVSLRILIADDDPMVRTALGEVLTLSGHAVMVAADGNQALEVLHSRHVDLVITDMMMPEMDGMELIEHATSVYPHLPFIVLTGHGTAQQARESLRKGAVDFLTKPVSAAELSIAVTRNIERTRLQRQKLREATAEVLFQTIQALADTIDLRDPHTAGHSQRVAGLADRLAEAAGVPEEDRYVLRLAGAMHDFGKIGISDAILMKPGALTDEEWVEMRRHPQRGSDVLRNIKELWQVANIIRHHHENVDGTGYPDGLKGDAIPPLARVLAVADAYEAMISDRAYRAAMSCEDAFAALRSDAGRRFDPPLVEMLIRIESGA